MVKLVNIRSFGDHLVALLDDGTEHMALDTNSLGFWVGAGTSGGGGTDPGGPGGEGFIQPFDPDAYDAADPFGASPGAVRNHTGSDYPMAENTPIRSISDGTVVGIDYESGNGNHLVVHAGAYGGREIFWAYIHLYELPSLAIGSTVSKGQLDIARSGNTGSNSHGGHLHISMSSTEDCWQGLGGLFDPHHFIETGAFIDKNW